MKNFNLFKSNLSRMDREWIGNGSGLTRQSLGKFLRYAAMIALLLSFSCAQAWGGDKYYLFTKDGEGPAHTGSLSGDFYCQQSPSESEKTIDGVTFSHCVAVDENTSLTASWTNKYAGKATIDYDMKTTAATFTIYAYNSNGSIYGVCKAEVEEGSSPTSFSQVGETFNSSGSKLSFSVATTKNKRVRIGTNASGYVKFYQIVVEETGTALPRPGQGTDYELAFTTSGGARYSSTAGSGKIGYIDGLEIVSGKDNKYNNNACSFTKATKGHYIKFTTSSTCYDTLIVTANNPFTYNTSNEFAGSTTASGTKIVLSPSTTYWIMGQSETKDVQVSKIEFKAPKPTAGVKRRMFLNLGGIWDTGQSYWVHTWGDGSPADYDMTQIGSTGYYYADIPISKTKVQYRRNANDNKTYDLDWSGQGEKQCARITAWHGGDGNDANPSSSEWEIYHDGRQTFEVDNYVYYDNTTSGWTNVYFRVGKWNVSQAYAMTKVAGTKALYSYQQTGSDWSGYEVFNFADNWANQNGNVYYPDNDKDTWSGNQTNFARESLSTSRYYTSGSNYVTSSYAKYYDISEISEYVVASTATHCSVSMVKYTADDGSTSAALASGGKVMPTQYIKVSVTPDEGYEWSSVSVSGTYDTETTATSSVDGVYCIKSNASVTAVCSAIDYDVTYSEPSNGDYTIKVDDGSATSETKTANIGQTITLAASPSDGYAFGSWTVTKEGGGTVTVTSNQFTMPADNVTITATFTAKSYNLTWNLGGGTTTSAGTGIASGVSANTTSSVTFGASLTAPTVTKTGYNFSAWSPSVASTMPAAATTYTATWTAKTYTISYYDGGATDNITFTGNHMPSYPTSHTYDSGTTTLKKASKAGYVFGGWYDNYSCEGDPVTSYGATAITANQKLYAKWTAMNLTPLANGTLYKAGDMVPDGVEISESSQYYPGVSANNRFNVLGVGHSNSSTGPLSSSTCSSKKTIDGVDFTESLYSANASTITSSLPTDHALQFKISGDGLLDIYCYDPVEMYLIEENGSAVQLDASGTGKAKITKTVSAGTYYIYTDDTNNATRLYGLKFTPTYSVTYKKNGGASGTDGSVTGSVPTDATAYESGQRPVVKGPGNLALEDHIFAGWNDKADGTGTYYSEKSNFAITADKTLYAVWRDISETTCPDGSSEATLFSISMNNNTTAAVNLAKGDAKDLSSYASITNGAASLTNISTSGDNKASITKASPALLQFGGADGMLTLYLDCPLDEDDEITISGTDSYEVCFTTTPSKDETIKTSDQTYTVTNDLKDAAVLYVWRVGSTTFGISGLTITRPADCTDVAAPTGLTCSTAGVNSLVFSWTAASNASSYDVYLYSDEDCTSPVTPTEGSPYNVSTTSATLTGLTASTTYYCKVQSKGNGTTYCEDGGETSAQSGTTLAQYDVTITVNPSGYGSVTESSLADVDAGTEISTSSNSLTIGETTITASPAATTAEYTYAFDGWTDDSEADLPDELTADLSVYANFTRTANSYTLAWNTNGGSDLAGDPTSGTVAYNTTLTFPTDPTLSNYTFDGWKTNNDGTGTAAAAKMPAATTTYYAAWKQTITLKTGSQGSGADITSAYVYLNGAAVNSYSAHDVSGCNLLGYYTEASAGTKVLNADGTFADDNVEDYITSGKWSRSGTTTLYAQWEAPLITWTLTTGSSSWSLSSYTNNATYVTGGSITTSADADTNSKSGATTKISLATASDNVDKAASFSFEIYLGSKYIEPSKLECQVWNVSDDEGLNYKAQLTDEVGNTYYSTNTVVLASDGKLEDATFTFASDLVLRGEVTIKVYCWKSSGSGTAFRMGPTVKLYGTEKDHVCSAPAAPTITGASTYATGATITLTASCASGADALTTYTWYKGDNYGMALVNDAIQAAAKASEGGNVLTINTCDADDAGTYWCNASNGVGCIEHNATGKMVMIADGYTITYNANGGSGSAPAAGKYVAGTTATVAGKNTLSKSGYTFMGWNTANDGTGIFYGVGSTFAMPASNMTLYAQWGDCESCTAHVWYNTVPDGKSNTDRFTFPSGAPSGTNGSAETMTIDGTDYTSAKRSGDWAKTFTFSVNTGCTGVLYFRIEGTGSNRVITITNTSTSATTTISGIGTGFDTYTSSSLAAGSYSVSVSANIHVALIALNECSPSGCTTYDVSFANMTGFGGTTTLPSTIEDVPTGSKIAQPASPVASGYKFEGWYSNAGCTAGNEINWSTMTITADKTIYAKWTDLSGKYTFHYGIGDPEDNSWVIVPFAQVGSTSKYQLENFEIPDADEYPYFFVGYEGAFADHSHIYEWDATYTSLTKTYGQLPVAYANGYGSAIGNYALCADGKMAEGAKGTLHISSESISDNYLLKFVPKGYALKWNGGTTELHATTNPKIFETNKVTLSSADVAGNFEVQIATKSSYVDCARTTTEDVDDLAPRKIAGETYDIEEDAEGRFQIVVDEKDNFGLRFVPLINRSYGKYSINWTEDEYWTLGRRPNIDEDAYLNNSVYVNVRDAQANKVIISKYGTHEGISGSTSNDGRLYVKPEGGLLIATTLKKLNSEGSEVANDNYFDVQIESDGTYGTGALITGSESANTQAYVQFYALARKDANGYLNQHFGIPTAQGSVYDFYNTYLYVFDRTLGASNENWYAASRKSSTMSPFTAYNLLRKESATGYYYMDGALNLPGKSGTKELICDDSDEDHDSNAAGDYMFANSWTAPIDIKAIEEEDFANAEATIYIFNAGSTYDESHADDAAQDATSAGQWISLPVEASAVLANELPLTVIPSMQGFLIKKTGTAATEAKLTLDYDKHVYSPAKDRVAGIEVKPARAPKHSNVNRPAVMKLYVDAESGNRDKLFILERADFSDAFDNGWDGRKILGESYAPQLYAVSADSKMSIDAISVIEGTVVGFRKGSNDEIYTISFKYDGEGQYYLNDLQEQEATLITDEAEYTFVSAAEDAEERFIISATPIQKVITDIDPASGGYDAKVRKVIINDHIYIIRGRRMYSVDGALVK